MTKNDFYQIIFESFDHIETPITYFNEKRGTCDQIEYARGLRKYFEQLKKLLNKTDFSRAERITPSGNYEIYLYEFGEKTENEIFRDLANKGELAFLFKKELNLVKFKSGQISLIDAYPVISTPHIVLARFDNSKMEKIEPGLNKYLQSFETSLEKSKTIPPEHMKNYTEQLQKMGEEMFLSLMNEYKKKWDSRFFAFEIDLVNSQIRRIDKYITELENLQDQRFKESEDNIQDLKRLPDDYYLPGYKNYLLWLQIRKKELETPNSILHDPQYSVLEWATIFYYADETKLLSNSRTIKKRMELFISNHNIKTTINHLKTSYYEAKKRINEKNDYPIDKLELIIPFLMENYSQTVTKVENDKIYLKENKSDY